MPIPEKKPGEDQDTYMGRCMSFMKGEKEKYPTQEQRVAICLNTFRGGKPRSESNVIEKIDNILNEAAPKYKEGSIITYQPFTGSTRKVKVTNKQKNIKNRRPGFDGVVIEPKSEKGDTIWGYDSQIEKVIKEERQCPQGQRWCPKCMDCIDLRESPGTGVPEHDCHKSTGAGYASVGRIGGVSNLASVGRTG